jgi:hypothetical protein
VDVVEEPGFFGLGEPVLVVAEEFDGGHGDAEGGTEFVADGGDEAAFEVTDFAFCGEFLFALGGDFGGFDEFGGEAALAAES